jgi:hypothetical protein
MSRFSWRKLGEQRLRTGLRTWCKFVGRVTEGRDVWGPESFVFLVRRFYLLVVRSCFERHPKQNKALTYLVGLQRDYKFNLPPSKSHFSLEFQGQLCPILLRLMTVGRDAIHSWDLLHLPVDLNSLSAHELVMCIAFIYHWWQWPIVISLELVVASCALHIRLLITLGSVESHQFTDRAMTAYGVTKMNTWCGTVFKPVSRAKVSSKYPPCLERLGAAERPYITSIPVWHKSRRAAKIAGYSEFDNV